MAVDAGHRRSAWGLPVWLVNPLLGTLTLGLIWGLGARLYSGRVGVAAAFLVAVSPFFLFNAASYFSHTFCGVLLLGAACIASRPGPEASVGPDARGIHDRLGCRVEVSHRRRSPVSRLSSGCCDRACRACGRSRSSRSAAAHGRVALAAYNATMTGSMLRLTTTPLTVSLWLRDGWLLRSADILSTHLLRHLLWTPPAVMVAYLVYLRTAPADTRRPPLEWMLDSHRRRPLLLRRAGRQPVRPPLPLRGDALRGGLRRGEPVSRAHACRPARRIEAWLFALMVISVLAQPVSFAVHARLERAVIVERMDPFIQAERAGLSNALVLIADRVGSARSIAAADLTRNGIDYDGPVLYGLDQADDRAVRLGATRAGAAAVLLYLGPCAPPRDPVAARLRHGRPGPLNGVGDAPATGLRDR